MVIVPLLGLLVGWWVTGVLQRRQARRAGLLPDPAPRTRRTRRPAARTSGPRRDTVHEVTAWGGYRSIEQDRR